MRSPRLNQSEQVAFHLPVGVETQETTHFLQKAIMWGAPFAGNTQDMHSIYQLRPLAGASSEGPIVLRMQTADVGHRALNWAVLRIPGGACSLSIVTNPSFSK